MTQSPPLEQHVLDPGRIRLAASFLIALVSISSLYFFTGRGWNQAAHFDLVRAIVEHGSICIDEYHQNTGDKSFYGGHYFSNKAPGTPFLAVPFVAVSRSLIRLLGGDPSSEASLLLQMRTGALICGTIPTVAAVLSLFYVGIRLGASISSSVLGALTFGLGTPAWIYSTMFWAHPLTTGCLATAFGLSIALTVSGSPKRDFILASSVGLAAGWAVATEYTAAGAAVLLAAFTLWHVHTDGRSRFLRVLGAIAAGALPPALILGAYHSAAFGSPFRVSYVSVVGFEGHQSGLYGFHLPPLSVILQLLFGSYRGLFVAAPVLAGGACTLAALILRPGHRAVAILAGAIFMSFLLFNASFYYWAAGWTVGPRYMAAGIPFLCVGLAPIVNDAGRVAKIGFAFLACTSIILMLAVLSTDAMPPDSVASPVWGLAVPTFLRGKFAQSLLGSPNLGQWIGLRGPGSLLPLLTIWLGLTVFWIRRDRLLANRAR